MSADAFLDTNILIYATQSTGPKAGVAAELLARGGVLSVQVLNKFANVARRKLGRSWPEVKAALADVRILCPEVRAIGAGTHEAALDLAAGEAFSFYDALIVASALEAGCATLWSEDMQDGRVVDERLTIRNPFRGLSEG